MLHPRHDGGAGGIAHAAPVDDFVDGAATTGAGGAGGVELAQVAAGSDRGRCHYMKL